MISSHTAIDSCYVTILNVCLHDRCALSFPKSIVYFFAAWGIGLLAVTIINLTAVMGFFFKPIMDTPIYKRVMMFMVSLAVGTLSGSALMILIPEVRICFYRCVCVYVCGLCECTSNCAYRHVSTKPASQWPQSSSPSPRYTVRYIPPSVWHR